MLAESKGLIIKDYRQFFMGHKGDIERRYTLARRNLPEPVLQSLRDTYSKASIYLETKISPESANLGKLYEFEANTKALILKLAGFSEGEITKGRYLELSPKEFLDLINERAKEPAQHQRAQQSAAAEGEWDRKVVTEEEDREFDRGRLGAFPHILKREDRD